MRGLQVVENLCANTSLMLGETLTGISKDMDLCSYRLPLGVCAGIAPFNFPAMIPLWMFPTGLITGNTYIMKPSERDPTACMALVSNISLFPPLRSQFCLLPGGTPQRRRGA